MTDTRATTRRLWVFVGTVLVPLLAVIVLGTVWMLRLRGNPEFPLYISALGLTATCVSIVATVAGIGFQVITTKVNEIDDKDQKDDRARRDLLAKKDRFIRIRARVRRTLMLLIPVCVASLVIVIGVDQYEALNGVSVQQSVLVNPSTLSQGGPQATISVTPNIPLRSALEFVPDISPVQGEDCRGAATLDFHVIGGNDPGASSTDVVPGDRIQLAVQSGTRSAQIAVGVHFQDSNCVGQLTVADMKTKGGS